jgi:hypothetical protein
MFKSLFKKKSNNNQEVSAIGLHIDHPILMRSIPDSYAYLGALCLLHDGLSFQRIGSVGTGAYPNPIDEYEFMLNGREFCTLYLYAYHNKSTPIIPSPFIALNPNADLGIFESMNTVESDSDGSVSQKINKYDLIDQFFIDQGDYAKFLVGSKLRIISNDETTCFAELSKEDGCFLYKLTWLKDGKFIGDYVKPFRATMENIDTFNEGCRILADRLTIYIETGNIDSVPSEPPAFKELTEVKT